MDLGCAGGFRRGRLEERGQGGDEDGKRKGWASGLRQGMLRWFGVVVWAGRSREGDGVTRLEVWLGPVGADQEVSGRLRARVRDGSVCSCRTLCGLGTFEVGTDLWGKGWRIGRENGIWARSEDE